MRHKISDENKEDLRKLLKTVKQNISVSESGSLRGNSWGVLEPQES